MADGTKLVSSSEHRWLQDSSQYKWTATEQLRAPIVTEELAERVRVAYNHGEGTHRSLGERFGLGRSTVQRITAGILDPANCMASRLVKILEPWDEDRSWGAGFIAAAFDGEGYLSQQPRRTNNGSAMALGVSQRPNAMSERLLGELADRGFKMRNYHHPPCHTWTVTGTREKGRTRRDEILRLLGSVRPPRLLSQFDADLIGCLHKKDAVAVIEKEYIGDAPVVAIKTGTGTFIAEGYASHNSEYAHQRPSAEFFLGVAFGRGIELHIPPGSDLLKATHLYGFEEGSVLTKKMLARQDEVGHRKEQMKGRLAQVDMERANLIAGINQLDGAMQDIQYWLRNWVTQPNGGAT